MLAMWFSIGWYGGLICCIFAITTNVLYTARQRCGRSRQLARVIVTCVISAFLLLPALLWFHSQRAVLSGYVIISLLAYVAICGWIVPLAITGFYCLLASRRPSAAVALDHESPLQASHAQQKVEAPFVYSQETAWGWLEYSSGSFHGQRLALKRRIVTIGRDEQCDIWLDDDMASRHHAELSWNDGQVSLTDCESLNGVLLNKQPVRGTVLLTSYDTLQIGTQHFMFIMTEQKELFTTQDDPLSRHTWRSTQDLQTAVSQPVPLVRNSLESIQSILHSSGPQALAADASSAYRDPTAQIDQATPLPQLSQPSALLQVVNGELVGHKFLLERPVMSIGRDSACDMVINDASISRQHAQFLHQADGIYLQDLASRNGTRVNDAPLFNPHLLQSGDMISIGKIHLAYITGQHEDVLPALAASILPRSLAGPTPLKLPSKRKDG